MVVVDRGVETRLAVAEHVPVALGMPPGVEVLQVADLRLAAGFGLHIHAAEVVVFAVLGGETALDVTRVGIFDRAAVLHVEGVDQTQRGTYGTHTGGRTGTLGNRVDHPGVTLAVVIPRDGALVDRTEDDLRVPAVVEEVVVGFVGVEILRIHAYASNRRWCWPDACRRGSRSRRSRGCRSTGAKPAA